MRLLRSGLHREEVEPHVETLVNQLFAAVPTGMGGKSKIRLSASEMDQVLVEGAKWAVEKGFGRREDLPHIESHGCAPGGRPELISKRAMERGRPQLGTLGSGNHFVEVGYVAEVYDEEAAKAFGLKKDHVTILIHTGSRGFGHQVCDDYIRIMSAATQKYGFQIPDRQLCCAPVGSREGRDYFSAMTCAMNYAFANRQFITHWAREVMERVLGKGEGFPLVYDVCHNIAKMEKYRVDEETVSLCVHRKGATRAFGPGAPEIPEDYKAVGQPVIIPGDMGRCSFVLAGTTTAMEETFGSTCHGAGRVMSRKAAIRSAKGRSIADELRERGIIVRANQRETLAEEMSDAYKNVSDVVDVVHAAGISRKVVKLLPMGIIKG